LSGCNHNNIFVHVESQHSKAIRIGVEFEMQIAEHTREPAPGGLHANMRIVIQKKFARLRWNLFASGNPLLRADVCETEMKPYRTVETLAKAGSVPFQALGRTVRPEPEAANQSCCIRKLDHEQQTGWGRTPNVRRFAKRAGSSVEEHSCRLALHVVFMRRFY
jgi:hypothetical protein